MGRGSERDHEPVDARDQGGRQHRPEPATGDQRPGERGERRSRNTVRAERAVRRTEAHGGAVEDVRQAQERTLSGVAWSSGFMRAFTGRFSDGVRHGHTSMADAPDPKSQIHTAIYERDKGRMPLLEPLTEYEARLFRRAGFDEVVSYRRWTAKEQGVKDWKEIGRSRYGIQAVPEEQRTLSTGVRPETQTGQGETEGRGSLPLPVVSQGDGPAVPATPGDDGSATSTDKATNPVEQGNRRPEAGANGIREGMQTQRPGVERSGSKNRNERATPANP